MLVDGWHHFVFTAFEFLVRAFAGSSIKRHRPTVVSNIFCRHSLPALCDFHVRACSNDFAACKHSLRSATSARLQHRHRWSAFVRHALALQFAHRICGCRVHISARYDYSCALIHSLCKHPFSSRNRRGARCLVRCSCGVVGGVAETRCANRVSGPLCMCHCFRCIRQRSGVW